MTTITRKCLYYRLDIGAKFKFPLEIKHLGDAAPFNEKVSQNIARGPDGEVQMATDEVVCQVEVRGHA